MGDTQCMGSRSLHGATIAVVASAKGGEGARMNREALDFTVVTREESRRVVCDATLPVEPLGR